MYITPGIIIFQGFGHFSHRLISQSPTVQNFDKARNRSTPQQREESENIRYSQITIMAFVFFVALTFKPERLIYGVFTYTFIPKTTPMIPNVGIHAIH